MPELPEVETIRRHLAPHVEGRTLEALEILDERWCRPLAPRGARRRGRGPRGRAARAPRQVPRLGARGRRVPAHAPAHDRHAAARPARRAAVHARVAAARRPRRSCSTTRGASAPASWRSGPRRSTRSSTRGSGSSRSTREFTGEHLYALARSSRAPIKAFLLDQKRSPASATSTPTRRCSARAIHPLRPANRLTRAQGAALRDAVVESLSAGIEAKGATIDDFRDPYGVSGTFQDQFLVHLREGEPCPRCGRPGAQAARRRARDLRVRALPAAAAATRAGRGGELGQAAGAVERERAPGSRRSARRR